MLFSLKSETIVEIRSYSLHWFFLFLFLQRVTLPHSFFPLIAIHIVRTRMYIHSFIHWPKTKLHLFFSFFRFFSFDLNVFFCKRMPSHIVSKYRHIHNAIYPFAGIWDAVPLMYHHIQKKQKYMFREKSK